MRNDTGNGIYNKIGISYKNFFSLKNGSKTNIETAKKVSDFYNMPLSKAFNLILKPLSNRTLSHYSNLLSTIFSAAVHWQVIEKKPVQTIEKVKVNKSKPIHFDDISVIKFLSALNSAPYKYKMAVYLALDTGLRISEVMGLTWNCLDEYSHSIDIDIVRQYISEYGEVNKPPKSESSKRNITLSDTVFDMLMEYKQYQEENKKIYHEEWEDNKHIITHENGKKMFPNRPSVWLKSFLEKNNLPSVTFHGLRHTNASLLISQNINPATVAERLGHSDKEITLNVYTHAIKSKDKSAADVMDNIYKKIK